MELNKTNSLVELFFEKYKEKKEFKNKPFLKWLKTNEKDFLTWEQVRNKFFDFFKLNIIRNYTYLWVAIIYYVLVIFL